MELCNCVPSHHIFTPGIFLKIIFSYCGYPVSGLFSFIKCARLMKVPTQCILLHLQIMRIADLVLFMF
jgi:hypothetical protein